MVEKESSRYDLPEAWLRARGRAEKLLARIEEIGRELRPFERVERHQRRLYLYSRFGYGHEQLCLVCRASSEVTGIVVCEARAAPWKHVPTTKTYLGVLRRLIDPVIVALKERVGLSLVLEVGPSHAPVRELPPQTRKRLDDFVRIARGRTTLGFGEWQAFYRFILYAHGVRVRLSEWRVGALLEREGFSPLIVGELREVYQHGRQLLQLGYGWGPLPTLDLGE